MSSLFFGGFFSRRKLSKKKKTRTESITASPLHGLSDIVTKESTTFTWVGIIEPTQACPPISASLTDLKSGLALGGSAPLTLPFALVTTRKGEQKQMENRESGPFRSTQPEVMKIAWFQRHTCMGKAWHRQIWQMLKQNLFDVSACVGEEARAHFQRVTKFSVHQRTWGVFLALLLRLIPVVSHASSEPTQVSAYNHSGC